MEWWQVSLLLLGAGVWTVFCLVAGAAIAQSSRKQMENVRYLPQRERN